LRDPFAVEQVPRARLLDEAVGGGEIEQLAEAVDAGAEHDLELGLAEGRGALVLDDLDPHARTDDLFAVLDLADAADVEAHRRVELERVAAGGGLGISENDPDLLTKLINAVSRRATDRGPPNDGRGGADTMTCMRIFRSWISM